MPKINQGHQIYNVLPNSLFDRLGDDLKYWEYCNESYQGDFMNWGRTPDWGELIFLEAAIHIKLKIQKIIRENVRCCKLHFNGQTVNQHSSFHKDYQEDIFWTFILFTQPHWNTEWGGEFVCYNPESKNYEYYPYIPNSGVLIQSNWDHHGRQPTNSRQDAFRTTVAYSYIAESMIDYHLKHEASPDSNVWRMLP